MFGTINVRAGLISYWSLFTNFISGGKKNISEHIHIWGGQEVMKKISVPEYNNYFLDYSSSENRKEVNKIIPCKEYQLKQV